MTGPTAEQMAQINEMQAMRDEALHPDLVPYVEESETWGKILRHPLVYDIGLMLPGYANRSYLKKTEWVREAAEACDWHTLVWLHERPYRLRALIDYVTGRDEDGRPTTLNQSTPQDVLDLVAQVWVDSENISEMMDEWRALFGTGREIFLGEEADRLAFNALPSLIPAYRAGIDDGDWSYSTDRKVAEFFAQRFQKPGSVPVVAAQIPKDWCFGYLTRRGESELLVRLPGDR